MLSKTTRKIIRADGTETELLRAQTMKEIKAHIGARMLDLVRLKDRIHVMIVDDQGAQKNLPFNEKATALYLQKCRLGTTNVIVGDVVVCRDDDF